MNVIFYSCEIDCMAALARPTVTTTPASSLYTLILFFRGEEEGEEGWMGGGVFTVENKLTGMVGPFALDIARWWHGHGTLRPGHPLYLPVAVWR